MLLYFKCSECKYKEAFEEYDIDITTSSGACRICGSVEYIIYFYNEYGHIEYI